jgi:DNA-binding winged helix-turn-helix (wHTH) protein
MPRGVRSPSLATARFRLGEWIVDPVLSRLTSDAASVRLEIRVMEVLVFLAQHATRLVTRRQIIDAVWGTTYISENTLTRAIAELRSSLGDDARDPTYIETIHRRGYRLIRIPEPIQPKREPLRKKPRRDWSARSGTTWRW